MKVEIGDIVKITVDRPLGSYHPEHKDMYYPVNYGYIQGLLAPDGEEQDAYILGVDEPVNVLMKLLKNRELMEKRSMVDFSINEMQEMQKALQL